MLENIERPVAAEREVCDLGQVRRVDRGRGTGYDTEDDGASGRERYAAERRHVVGAVWAQHDIGRYAIRRSEGPDELRKHGDRRDRTVCTDVEQGVPSCVGDELVP